MPTTRPTVLWRWSDGHGAAAVDALAVEAPLLVQVQPHGGQTHTLTLTMRTPGHDAELAAGLLWAEGILRSPADLLRVARGDGDTVRADLAASVPLDLSAHTRHVTTTSACGLCGRADLDALSLARAPARQTPRPLLTVEALLALPDALRAAQPAFATTGGLHATGLFTLSGELVVAREDVGRHNAFDKCVGHLALAGALPAPHLIAAVSGRASFELVQKAVMAGLIGVVAVGAPSSLAVDLARDRGLLLAGFVRGGRANVYAGQGWLLGA
jgi:FdhD protein